MDFERRGMTVAELMLELLQMNPDAVVEICVQCPGLGSVDGRLDRVIVPIAKGGARATNWETVQLYGKNI